MSGGRAGTEALRHQCAGQVRGMPTEATVAGVERVLGRRAGGEVRAAAWRSCLGHGYVFTCGSCLWQVHHVIAWWGISFWIF